MAIETLDLTGMDIDSVRRSFSVLTAEYGGGYQDGVLVGDAGGLHLWALSAGVIPDNSDIEEISGSTTFEYYWEFFQARKANGNEPFIIEFRGANYHASFVGNYIELERFTEDLFAGGVMIQQRRIRGGSYNADGSIDETP